MRNIKHASLILILGAAECQAQQSAIAALIQEGHWKRARVAVEARLREEPGDAEAYFFLSQVRNAFGDRSSPLALAEKAVALDGRVAKYHRQVAEVLGVMAEHSNAFQQMLLARRFRKEIDTALQLDPRDSQALRDLVEFYLLAPGLLGGDREKAKATASRIAAIDEMQGRLAMARIAEVEHRPDQQHEWLRKAVEGQPSSYEAKIALARFDVARHPANLVEAESVACSAVETDSGRAEARSVLAEIYALQGRWVELERELGESAREVPDDLAPYYRAAERIVATGRDRARAERYLRVYLEQEPEGNEPGLGEARRLLQAASHAPRAARPNPVHAVNAKSGDRHHCPRGPKTGPWDSRASHRILARSS